MNANKAAKLMIEHGVKVVEVYTDAVKVEAPILDTATGEWVYEQSVVKATVEDVRDFLGY